MKKVDSGEWCADKVFVGAVTVVVIIKDGDLRRIAQGNQRTGIAEDKKVDFVWLIGHVVVRECELYILGESPVCDESDRLRNGSSRNSNTSRLVLPWACKFQAMLVKGSTPLLLILRLTK